MKNERLIRIRKPRTQIEFARALGVHKNTVARYESGEREPDGGYLRALINLGWNPLWILTGAGTEKIGDMSSPARDTLTIVQGPPDDPEVQAAQARRTRSEQDWSAGFAEGAQTAPSSQSQPVRLDEQTLAEALRVIDQALVLTRRQATSAARARLVAKAYRVLAEEDQVSRALERIMHMVAEVDDTTTEGEST